MKIKDKKSRRALYGVIIVVIILVLSVAGVVGYLAIKQNADKKAAETAQEEKEKAEEEKKKAEDDNKAGDEGDKTTPEDVPKSDEGDGKTPQQNEGENTAKKDELTGVINYKAVVGDNLQVRTTINQYLTTGSCYLTLTGPNNLKYENTVNIIANPQSSTCYGFDVPLDAMGENDKRSGKWTIEVKMTSGSKTGTMTSEITL